MDDLAVCKGCNDYGCFACGYCEACMVPAPECECMRLHDLRGDGHTEECARRIVWRDGLCECGQMEERSDG